MFKSNMKKSFYISVISLFTVTFLLWTFFYINTNTYIQENTKTQLNNAANQIMNELGKEFSQMEQLVFSLSQNPNIKSFVSEKDIENYYNKSAKVNELISGSMTDFNFINNIIIYNHEGAFYRFVGDLGNTVCTNTFYLMSKTNTPDHLVVILENTKLIGYGSNIYNARDEKIGSVVILIDEETILNRLAAYNLSETVHVAVAAKDKIVFSNVLDNSSVSLQDIKNNSYYYTDRHIGITPFDILVWSYNNRLSSSNMYFIVAITFTIITFISILIYFTVYIKNQFINPMIHLMDRVENLDVNISPNFIPYVKNTEINKLIDKINDLLKRIDEKNKTIQNTQLLLKNSEIRKHKATIFSLKKQINAHFTVNIINIVGILISNKKLKQAEALCDGLSMLIRYAHDEDEFINAWDEFHVLENYINTMNIRYGNKIRSDFDIDDRLMDHKMPRMLLQPIIENAIVHGYRGLDEKCTIDIVGEVKENNIIIMIRDYGQGMSKKTLDELMQKIKSSSEEEQSDGIESIALKNIHQRLLSYYGDDCGVSISSELKKGTQVMITVGITRL